MTLERRRRTDAKIGSIGKADKEIWRLTGEGSVMVGKDRLGLRNQSRGGRELTALLDQLHKMSLGSAEISLLKLFIFFGNAHSLDQTSKNASIYIYILDNLI